MLEAVFFDVDGMLIDDDADWRSSVKRLQTWSRNAIG